MLSIPSHPDPAQYSAGASSQPPPPETSAVVIESSGTASSTDTKALPVPAKSPLKERKSELPISRFCLSPSVSDSSSQAMIDRQDAGHWTKGAHGCLAYEYLHHGENTIVPPNALNADFDSDPQQPSSQ